jgi:DNA-directed RNA polymerase subunit RPC12/RpoP
MIKARYKCGYCDHIFALAYFNSQDIPERNIGCPNCRVAGEKTILIKKIRDETGKPFVPTEGMDKKIKSHLLYPITVLESERDNAPHQPGSLIAQLNKAIEILNEARRSPLNNLIEKLEEAMQEQAKMSRKLIVEFKESNIEIRTVDGDINIGIPYHFDIKFGEKNLKHLLEVLGFCVTIK